jgi:uncharacterized protein
MFIHSKFYKMNNLDSLQEKLDNHANWPLSYMFKFIVPAQNDKIARVEALFSENAVITRKESRFGKYISITAKQMMNNSANIIDIYRKASKIENIVAL